MFSYSVVVITPDFESGTLGSNPSKRISTAYLFQFSYTNILHPPIVKLLIILNRFSGGGGPGGSGVHSGSSVCGGIGGVSWTPSADDTGGTVVLGTCGWPGLLSWGANPSDLEEEVSEVLEKL